MKLWSKKLGWIYWGVFTAAMTVYFTLNITSANQMLFLPGKTSHGHYQIEMACKVCHESPFGGKEVLQKSCVKCHGQELKVAKDKHPKSKFTDPRNADRVAKLDARYCITCHVEHKPEITAVMGVTVAQDVCYLCHYDIAKDRPSHKGMAFTTCADAGCHNFHDDRALYEDFLLKHLDEPVDLASQVVPPVSAATMLVKLDSYPLQQYPLRQLGLDEQDAPADLAKDQKALQEWHETAHARSGVNCSACHKVEDKNESVQWVKKPSYDICKKCHKTEVNGFLAGKHGMRLAQRLSPMTPALARQPMRSNVRNKQLNCATCHGAHRFDTVTAAVDACLTCHNDTHSLAYKKSPHFRLWQKEVFGQLPKSSGVSCATCHLPREMHKHNGKATIRTQHNQNDNLRPNEKMLRPVCMKCHGLGFSIDALADTALIRSNFNGKPSRHVNSLEMAKSRALLKSKEHKKGNQQRKDKGGESDLEKS
jgi:hypothetical protein